VRDRGLVHAVLQGYGDAVPRGRYPIAAVFIDVAGGGVDVNVHPQKLEVRFADPQAVYAAVRHAVARGAADAPWPDEVGEGAPLRALAHAAPAGDPRGPWPGGGEYGSALAAAHARERARAVFGWARGLGSGAGAGQAPSAQTTGAASRERWAPTSVWPGGSAAPPPEAVGLVGARAWAGGEPITQAAPARAAATATPPGFFAGLRFLGQLERTYLVCEGAGELVLVEQHAAHERVALDRLRGESGATSLPRQQLLLPRIVELAEGEAAARAGLGEGLTRLGYEVEPFGEAGSGRHAIAVRSVPAGLRVGEDAIAVLRALLADLAGTALDAAIESRLERGLRAIACHSVIRAGDALGATEAAALLVSLDRIDPRAPWPHGRAPVVRLSVGELVRRLGR
jgi:DNA mismatch repair protein MutL